MKRMLRILYTVAVYIAYVTMVTKAFLPALSATGILDWFLNGVPFSFVLCFILGGGSSLLLDACALPFVHLVNIRYGYRLEKLQLFFWCWERDPDDRLTFVRKKRGFRVDSLYSPPTTDGSSPYLLPLLAHDICMLIFAAVLLPFGLIGQNHVAFLLLALLGSLAVFYMFLSLPWRLVRLRWLMRDPHSRRAHEENLHTSAMSQRGIYLADMPDEWFPSYPAEAGKSPFVAHAMTNQMIRLFNSGHYEAAYERIRQLVTLRSALGNINHGIALLNGALCEMLLDKPHNLLQQALDMKPGSNADIQLTHGCVCYAHALLIQRDAGAAQPHLSAWESRIARLPQAHADIERRIMADIHRKAQEVSA